MSTMYKKGAFYALFFGYLWGFFTKNVYLYIWLYIYALICIINIQKIYDGVYKYKDKGDKGG